jgi:aldose 1-epimerase
MSESHLSQGMVLSSTHPAPSGQQWTISSGAHEAVLVEVGGGLRAYQVGGVDVVDGYAENELCPSGAGQQLMPWPNRIRDGRYHFDGAERQLSLSEPARHNAMHGLVRWERWHVVSSAVDSLTLGFDLPPQPGYPWPLQLRTTWTVGQDGLRCDVHATNLGDRPGPFGFGAHPYLMPPGGRVDDVRLKVPARNRLLVDGRMLPIGAARVEGSEFDYTTARRIGAAMLDTAFGDVIIDANGLSTVELSTSDSPRTTVWADDAFRWWQVFTADTLSGDRYRRSVAVEPMTCPPDAFRSGRDLVVLQPGQTWHGSWGIRHGVS